MRLLPCLLLLSDLLLGTTAYGQAPSVTRYKSYDGHLYTRHQADSMVAQVSQRGHAQGLGAYLDLQQKQLRHDTLVYSFAIMRCSQAMVEAHTKLMRFVDQPLPAFELRDLAGRVVKSQALRGKPLVLNLWFTTCTGCIEEMPALNTVQADPVNQHIQFLALTYETPTAVRTFLQKRPFHFRHLPAAKAYCDVFTQAYPLTIFVDKQGVVRAIQGPLPFMGPQAWGAKAVPNATGDGYLDATALYSALNEIR
jgi:cytochrome c biogenesis protein CcmG/thiol:disulfide interchange protein DsbE